MTPVGFRSRIIYDAYYTALQYVAVHLEAQCPFRFAVDARPQRIA